jgi:hypothetical protein
MSSIRMLGCATSERRKAANLPRNHFLSPRSCPETKSAYPGALVKQRGAIMLSEKFILILEVLLKSNSRDFPDGSPRVVSTSPHVPVKLPAPPGEVRL